MPKGVKYRDNVTRRLELLPVNTHVALVSGVTAALSKATEATRAQVAAAVTRTGKARVAGGMPPGGHKPRPAWFLGRGPGRIESGAMLASARWQTVTTTAGVKGTGGFINPPRYTRLQEEGSGGSRGVPAMLAYARGHTIMAARFGPTMDTYVERAIRYAEQGKLLQNRYL